MEKIITDVLMDVVTLVEVRRLTTRFVDLTQTRNANTIKSWLADFTNGEVREFDGTKVAPYVIESANYQVEVLPFEIRVLKTHFASYVKAGDTKDNESHNAPVSDNAVNKDMENADNIYVKSNNQHDNIVVIDLMDDKGVYRPLKDIIKMVEKATKGYVVTAPYEDCYHHIGQYRLFDGEHDLYLYQPNNEKFKSYIEHDKLYIEY